MKNTDTYDPLLELMERPAFLVKDGTILQTNQAARQRMITDGDPITRYLSQNPEAYNEFKGGCLYLTLNIEGIKCGASLMDLDGKQLFLLDEMTAPQLQALSLAAQQLRLPMNSVFLAAEVMEDRKKAAQITHSLSQMHRIVCNMADAVRYYEQTDFCGETTDLNSFFAEIMEKAAALIRDAGIKLKYTALPQSITGFADRQMLERAVLNLISNAVKFSPKHGTVEAKLTCKGHMLYFTICDNGDGIDPSIRSSLFMRYLRSPGIEDSTHGLGLGLCVVRSAAANHGGTVLIDHPENGGTRVTMTIDLRPREDGLLRSPISIPTVDYAGGHDHALLELSDILPHSSYSE